MCQCLAEQGPESSKHSKLFSVPTADALQLLNSWMTQPGLPLLKLSAEQSKPPVLMQTRFHDWEQNTIDGPFVDNSGSTWYVPMAVQGLEPHAGHAENAWFEISNQSQVVDGIDSTAGGLNLNAGGSGYFR